MSPPSLLPVLDHVEGLRRVAGDEDLYAVLIDVFLRDLPRMLEQIDAAIAAEASGSLKCAAHSLRGSASQIGANAVAAHAGQLEELARQGSFLEAGASRLRLGEALAQLSIVLHAADRRRRDA